MTLDYSTLVTKLRCPACYCDKLRVDILTSPGDSLRGDIICQDCDRAYEIYDDIFDLVVGSTTEMNREDDAHKRESQKHNGDDTKWLLGLPESNIERQNNDRNRMYAHALWPLFCQVKDALHLSERDEVLEIGAGVTWATRYIAREGYNCTALDLNTYIYRGLKSAHVYFQHETIRYHLIRGLMENLPLKDKTYDKIFSIATLHHSSNLSKTFSEIYRVLRPGGMAIIVDSTTGWRTRIIYRKHIEEMRNTWGLNDHQFTLIEWLEAARKAEFRQVDVLFPNYLMDQLKIKTGLAFSTLKPFLNLLLPLYHYVWGTGLVLAIMK